MGSTKTVSAINVRTDDVGSILNLCIGFSLCLSALANQMRLSFPLALEASRWSDTEFLYRVPIVDRGTIAAPLFATTVSDSQNVGVRFSSHYENQCFPATFEERGELATVGFFS